MPSYFFLSQFNSTCVYECTISSQPTNQKKKKQPNNQLIKQPSNQTTDKPKKSTKRPSFHPPTHPFYVSKLTSV